MRASKVARSFPNIFHLFQNPRHHTFSHVYTACRKMPAQSRMTELITQRLTLGGWIQPIHSQLPNIYHACITRAYSRLPITRFTQKNPCLAASMVLYIVPKFIQYTKPSSMKKTQLLPKQLALIHPFNTTNPAALLLVNLSHKPKPPLNPNHISNPSNNHTNKDPRKR